MNRFIMVNGIVTTLGALAIAAYRFGAWGFALTLFGALAVSLFWFGYAEDLQENNCESCRWYSDEFTSVCCNDQSDSLADFVDPEYACPLWEEKYQAASSNEKEVTIHAD